MLELCNRKSRTILKKGNFKFQVVIINDNFRPTNVIMMSVIKILTNFNDINFNFNSLETRNKTLLLHTHTK